MVTYNIQNYLEIFEVESTIGATFVYKTVWNHSDVLGLK